MVALYKELQPVDAYKIMLSHPFSDYDRQLLTLFYQPLVGSNAISLFMILWADAEQESEFNHYHLMNVLTLPLGPIFEARISLEAIGLLRTYMKKEGDARHFLYELSPPLDAKTFFNDPLLSTFLFSKIGEQAYRNLRSRFLKPVDEMEGFGEVSRSFLDVFKPVTPSLNVDTEERGEVIGRKDPANVPFDETQFDFDLLQSGLSEQMVPRASLSAVPRETIAKLAFLYSLTPLDMQKVIMMALDEDLRLPELRLRRAAADFYKMNVSKKAPTLRTVFTQQQPAPQPEKKMSREDELLYYLESTPPAQMLRDINGKEPLSVDVQLAERLINTHELPVGVVNVLLQYVHLRNDGKITNNFVERIASHWMNKKVSTAKEAMELSRKDHDKYMQWKNEGQQAAPRRNQRQEKVPEWFYKKEDKKKTEKPVKPKGNQESDKELEEERRKLLEELKGSGVK